MIPKVDKHDKCYANQNQVAGFLKDIEFLFVNGKGAFAFNRVNEPDEEEHRHCPDYEKWGKSDLQAVK